MKRLAIGTAPVVRERRRRCRSSNAMRGFTLLELLVAIALMAILAVLSWQGLQTLIVSRDRITAAGNEMSALSLAFTQMDEDLRRSWPVRLFGTERRPITFLAPQRDGDPPTLMILRENATSEPLQVQRVVYRLRDGVLERGFSRWLASDVDTAFDLESLTWQPLINDIRSLNFTAYLGNRWLTGQALIDRSNLPRPQLPPAVGGLPSPSPPYDGFTGLELVLDRGGQTLRRVFAVED